MPNETARLLKMCRVSIFLCMFILHAAVDGQSLGKCPKRESMQEFNPKEVSLKYIVYYPLHNMCIYNLIKLRSCVFNCNSSKVSGMKWKKRSI